MEIRQLTESELELHFQLSEYAFQYEMTEEDRQLGAKKASPDQIWGAFIEGNLASKMAILPLETYIHGKTFAMGGIASVATWPEYRRQGLVAKLLIRGLEIMKQNGQTLSFLAPFSFPFYRKYGWEIHGEYKKYNVKVEQLPKVKGKGRMERITKENEGIRSLYESFARGFNGTLKRNDSWWENRIFTNRSKGGVALYRDEPGEPKGYLYYHVWEKKMTIHEMVYLDHDCYLGLWEFIAQHDSMIKEVELEAHNRDPLPLLVDDPTFEQKVVPYFMVRIVDVKTLLEEYPFNWQSEDEQAFLHITDKQADWNNGTFLVQPKRSEEQGNHAGQNSVTFYPQKQTELSCAHPPKKGLSCDIQTLSTLLIGYQRPAVLHELGRLKGESQEVEQWEKLLPQGRTTYLMDFF